MRLILLVSVLAFALAVSSPSLAQVASLNNAASERITENGLQCGTTNLDVEWLSPTDLTANDTRLDRLKTLMYRADTLTQKTLKFCPPNISNKAQPGLPGCSTVIVPRAT